jgi:hypothetical protein
MVSSMPLLGYYYGNYYYGSTLFQFYVISGSFGSMPINNSGASYMVPYFGLGSITNELLLSAKDVNVIDILKKLKNN